MGLSQCLSGPNLRQPLAVSREEPGGGKLLHPNWGGEILRKDLHVQVGSQKPTCHRYLLLAHKISYTTPPHTHWWPRNPERKPASKLINEALMSAPSLPEGCLGATIDSPQNSGNHWQILVDSEACFSPMTCPRGERERCHKPCLPGLRPPFLPLPWPGHGQHSCCLHCSSGRGMLPILFLKALLYMILELQRRKFLKECLNGEHSTQEAWLTDITQNESLHLRLLPGLLPPLLRVSQ